MKKKVNFEKEAELTMQKIRAISRHIRNVEDNCLLLGEKLILKGEIDLGKQLIANGFAHDVSKFYGIEFEYLSLNNPAEESGKLKMRLAIQHHASTNSHHPEFWAQGIKSMPDLYIAEAVVDWKSRSEEFGTDLRQWIDEYATKKWNFTKDDEIYKKIMGYVDLLCDIPFQKIV
jgi:hypothetical protein